MKIDCIALHEKYTSGGLTPIVIFAVFESSVQRVIFMGSKVF